MADTAENAGFDLEERTAAFGEAVLRFVRQVARGPANDPIVMQLVRSATSVGANYCEANDGVSKKDFRNKIGICRKESKETKHWLRMIVAVNEDLKPQARELWQEAKELNLIFSKIFRSSGESE
ncbi:MAG: four helix bundle protein [Phycisphaerae bacterium]|jgi:four helix bundle protein